MSGLRLRESYGSERSEGGKSWGSSWFLVPGFNFLRGSEAPREKFGSRGGSPSMGNFQ
jgi:hypothetical protein